MNTIRDSLKKWQVDWCLQVDSYHVEKLTIWKFDGWKEKMIKVSNMPSWPASCAALPAAELRLILHPDEWERGGGHQLFIPPSPPPSPKKGHWHWYGSGCGSVSSDPYLGLTALDVVADPYLVLQMQKNQFFHIFNVLINEFKSFKTVKVCWILNIKFLVRIFCINFILQPLF
jgi:hypothetical protein